MAPTAVHNLPFSATRMIGREEATAAGLGLLEAGIDQCEPSWL